MYNRYKQNLDYNCAAGAVAFFVHVQSGRELGVEHVTRKLGCHPETGTDHETIAQYLRYLFRYEDYEIVHGHHIPFSKVELPLLVNYYSGEDGHYGVLTEVNLGMGHSSVALFDPGDGEMHLKDWGTFVQNWYSPRYGKNWGLYIPERKAS